MADKWDQYRTDGGDEWDRYRTDKAPLQGFQPGTVHDPTQLSVGTSRNPPPPGSRENPLNEQHPDVDNALRFKVKALLGTSPEVAQRELEAAGFEASHLGGSDFAIHKEGETEWRRVEPTGIDSMRELVGDVTDVAGDVLVTGGQLVGEGLGMAGGGAVGSLGGPAAPVTIPAGAYAGKVGGGALGGRVGREAVMRLGRALGFINPTDEEIAEAGREEAMVSAIGSAIPVPGTGAAGREAAREFSKLTGLAVPRAGATETIGRALQAPLRAVRGEEAALRSEARALTKPQEALESIPGRVTREESKQAAKRAQEAAQALEEAEKRASPPPKVEETLPAEAAKPLPAAPTLRERLVRDIIESAGPDEEIMITDRVRRTHKTRGGPEHGREAQEGERRVRIVRRSPKYRSLEELEKELGPEKGLEAFKAQPEAVLPEKLKGPSTRKPAHEYGLMNLVDVDKSAAGHKAWISPSLNSIEEITIGGKTWKIADIEAMERSLTQAQAKAPVRPAAMGSRGGEPAETAALRSEARRLSQVAKETQPRGWNPFRDRATFRQALKGQERTNLERLKGQRMGRTMAASYEAPTKSRDLLRLLGRGTAAAASVAGFGGAMAGLKGAAIGLGGAALLHPVGRFLEWAGKVSPYEMRSLMVNAPPRVKALLLPGLKYGTAGLRATVLAASHDPDVQEWISKYFGENK